jgi:hypothetical protein
VETDLPLNASCPEKKMTTGVLSAGVGFPIAQAQLRIAGQQLPAKPDSAGRAIRFRVNLKGGTRTRLHAWFQDAEGKDLCGAYYANVRRG